MKKIPINNLDLDLFYKKLDNGLEVYIIPNNKVKNIYTTYTTKFGANNLEFIYDNKMINLPQGIAHFLEHKIFEQEDGSSPFSEFDKNGASCNAFTNFNQTTYLFSGPDNFEKNLNLLIDFISKPYFTLENVEKEKGIIIQEIKMYEDSPFREGFKILRNNVFKEHPLKYDIGGTEESVNSINKDDLYMCYNTFYDPSNMFIVITGNVIPNDAIKVIENNFSNDKKDINIINKKYNEINEVVKQDETINMNVTIPKLNYGIKINMDDFDFPYKLTKQYLSLFFDSIIGATSELSEHLKNIKIITDDLDYCFEQADNYLLVIIIGESKEKDILIENIKNELVKIPTKETFERKKKVFLSSIITATDSIFRLNDMVTSSIINNNEFNTDVYNQIKSLDYNDLLEILSKINFANTSILYIDSKEK